MVENQDVWCLPQILLGLSKMFSLKIDFYEITYLLFVLLIGTKMLNHVLNICEKDGTFDNIYL